MEKKVDTIMFTLATISSSSSPISSPHSHTLSPLLPSLSLRTPLLCLLLLSLLTPRLTSSEQLSFELSAPKDKEFVQEQNPPSMGVNLSLKWRLDYGQFTKGELSVVRSRTLHIWLLVPVSNGDSTMANSRKVS